MKLKTRLTDTRIRTLKPESTEWIAWDTVVPHLGVRVRPNGSKRFVHMVKILGRVRKETLGHIEALTLDEAREMARELNEKAKTATEVPPPKGGVSDKKSPTFGEFVEEVWRPHALKYLKESTYLRVDNSLGKHLLPRFGKKPLDQINKKTILDWFDSYSRRFPAGANRVLDILSAILNHAVRKGVIPHNPAKRISRNPKQKITRFLSDEERERLLYALGQVSHIHADHADAIRLLLFTGCRRGEIENLRWDEVEDTKMNLTDSKTGPRPVWIGDEAKELLDRRRAEAEAKIREGGKPNPYVFPHRRTPNAPMSSLEYFWRKIRKEIGLIDFRMHSLRHSYASEAIRRGVPLPVVSKLLGHSSITMTMRYTHVTDKEAEEAAARIGKIIGDILEGTPCMHAGL